MTKYHITSKAGADYGIYEGNSKAEALCALHKAAGYWCYVEDDVIIFRCDQDAFVCGQVKDWHFDEVKKYYIQIHHNDGSIESALNTYEHPLEGTIEECWDAAVKMIENMVDDDGNKYEYDDVEWSLEEIIDPETEDE